MCASTVVRAACQGKPARPSSSSRRIAAKSASRACRRTMQRIPPGLQGYALLSGIAVDHWVIDVVLGLVYVNVAYAFVWMTQPRQVNALARSPA